MNHNKQCKCYIPICVLPSPTISPVFMLLSTPPRMNILSLIETAPWSILGWLKRDWEEARLLVLTSMLRSESIPLPHLSKRCKMSRRHSLRRRLVDDRFQRQRGCGRFSLGRRIKGWEGWEEYLIGITYRKRRDVRAVGWESFDACCSSISSWYDESCKMKDVWNTNNRFSLDSLESCLIIDAMVIWL